jgi:hypothetical protein
MIATIDGNPRTVDRMTNCIQSTDILREFKIDPSGGMEVGM